MMLLNVFGVHAIGANGIIDFLLYNLPLGTTKSNWPMFILVGGDRTHGDGKLTVFHGL